MRVSLPPLMRELLAYGLSSAAAFATDIGLLAVLVRYAGLHYLAAATISFVSGALVLYLLAITVVFRFRRIDNRTLELTYFVALGGAGLAVNVAVMAAVVELAHLHFLAAKVIAAGCTFLVNFLLRRQLLFVPAAPSGSPLA